jgi:hypothetical protein
MPIEYVIEEVRIDPSTRTMTTYTRNIGHIKYVVSHFACCCMRCRMLILCMEDNCSCMFFCVQAADEKCLYRPATSAEGNATTSCDRQVWVSSGMRSAIGSAIQQYVFRSMRSGLNNTIAGWNWTLARLFQAPAVHVDEKMTAHQRMQHIADKFHDTALREKEKLRTTAEQAKDLARQSLATSSG